MIHDRNQFEHYIVLVEYEIEKLDDAIVSTLAFSSQTEYNSLSRVQIGILTYPHLITNLHRRTKFIQLVNFNCL